MFRGDALLNSTSDSRARFCMHHLVNCILVYVEAIGRIRFGRFKFVGSRNFTHVFHVEETRRFAIAGAGVQCQERNVSHQNNLGSRSCKLGYHLSASLSFIPLTNIACYLSMCCQVLRTLRLTPRNIN